MFSTGVFAADTDLKGEVNTFIAASLSNAMEEIQKDFNETYPDVEIPVSYTHLDMMFTVDHPRNPRRVRL